MRDCILHVGLPKTGTTSIQSSLFRGLHDRRFRLLSLDTVFGNRTIAAAFAEQSGAGSPHIAGREPIRARAYLELALQSAANRGITPVFSAEIIGILPDAPLARIRDFLRERGFTPRVIAYARAPLDLVESAYQQRVRTGDLGVRLSEQRDRLVKYDYLRAFQRLDQTFGAEAVTIRWFDPAVFPDRCVVRDFCEIAHIPFDSQHVIRENDSMNLAAVRFLHALIVFGDGRARSMLGRFAWQVLLDRLTELSGPPLRFHASLTRAVLENLHHGWSAFEERLGRPLPFSLYEREPAGGICREEDLLRFSEESLEWLASVTGQRVVRCRTGDTMVREVVSQLRQLAALRQPIRTGRVAAVAVRDRVRRRWLMFRNTR